MASSLRMNPNELSPIMISHSTGSRDVTLNKFASNGTGKMNGMRTACPRSTGTRDLFPKGPVAKNVLLKDLQLNAKKISNRTTVAKTILRALSSANATG